MSGHRHLAPAVLVSVSSLVAAFAGCNSGSSGSHGTTAPPTDAGIDAPPPVVVTNENESKQSGRVIRAQTDEGVAGATVTIAGKSVVTGVNGDYEILVPRNVPYRVAVTADGFYKLLEQEWIVREATHVRGDTNLLKTETANLLAELLPGRKAEKGIVVVKVHPLPPCETEDGSTLTIDPPGEALVRYFSGPIPSGEQASVQGGTDLSAAFYNVDVGVPLTVAVHSAKCQQAPFPLDLGEVTYTRKVITEPGEAFAYFRAFLRETNGSDAGSD